MNANVKLNIAAQTDLYFDFIKRGRKAEGGLILACSEILKLRTDVDDMTALAEIQSGNLDRAHSANYQLNMEAHNLRSQVESLTAERDQLRANIDYLYKTHARAMKLITKGKPFLVVANDEPYYRDVYWMIREEETKALRWSDEDERIYREAIK